MEAVSVLIFDLADFFFELYPDHHDLHSFPTRRSSDLARHRRRVPGLTSRRCAPSAGPEGAGVGLGPLPEGTGLPDRKSTRLNSSHVENSYAVFCLKKKNNSHRSEGWAIRWRPA